MRIINCARKESVRVTESVLAFLLDTTKEAAKACKDEKKDYAFARNVLRVSVHVAFDIRD